MQKIEFLYDFGNPDAYLVYKVLPGIAARTGAAVTWVPVLARSLSEGRPRAIDHKELTYRARETERFIARHGIRFHSNPFLPFDTQTVLRGATFARGKDWESKYLDAIFDAIWVHGQRLDDPDVIAGVLQDSGLPRRAVLDAAQDGEIAQALTAHTQTASARGAFDLPTFFVGDEMFYGKAALPDLQEHLHRGA